MRRALINYALAARNFILPAALLLGAPVLADEPGCEPLPDSPKIQVGAIGQNFDLVLDDGKILTLPSLSPPRATAANFPARAYEKLKALTLGPKSWRALGSVDRWGRTPARIFAEDGRGLDDILLAQGLAMVSENPGRCAAAARAAENLARAQKIGIWGDPELGLVDEAHFSGLRAREGQLTLIEAKIFSVGHGRGKTYLNLGKPFHAPALVIFKKHLAEFAKAGLDPEHLAGRKILVRGVVGFGADGGGEALIELFHPAQIDVMDEGRSASP